MSSALELTINGRPRTVEGLGPVAKLDELMAALELRADRVAVELNGELASRKLWPETEVRSGDRLEVVHFVGGGV